MTGRPSTFTPEKFAEIIDRVSQGEPLAQVCRDAHMPALRTVYDWTAKDADLSARFARAREAGFDMIAQDALRIADTPVAGERRKESDDGVEIVTEDMLGHRRLQVETRLKLLAKWDPKRYGDRTTVAGDAEAPLTVQVVRLAAPSGDGEPG